MNAINIKKKLIRSLIVLGCLTAGSTFAMADIVTLGDGCNSGTYTTTTGTNDLGFHCSGFATWEVFLVDPNTNLISDDLWATSADEVYFSDDSSVDGLIGTVYAGQGQGFVYETGGADAITIQTNDGPWLATIQSDVDAPEPSSVFLMSGSLLGLAFIVKKRVTQGAL